MSPSLRPLAVVFLVACGACASFGADQPDNGAGPPDASTDGASTDGASTDGASTDGGSTDGSATLRCGDIACPASKKCCLPLTAGDAGCIDRGAICASGAGELLCSSPTACRMNEACCVTVERNGGQTAFDITRSFCVAASACPDQNLQRSLCDLGSTDQCPGRACKPYLHDINDLKQDLAINPRGYATCQ